MKHLIKLIFLSFGLISLSFSGHAQQPCLKVNGDAGTACPLVTDEAAAIPVGSNFLSFEVINNPETLDKTVRDSRYKAFWMFGDGNFRTYDYGTLDQDLATYRQTYVYPAVQATYQPMAVLSERKSNTSPPRHLQRTINVNGTNVTPGINDTFAVRIWGDKTLDIFNHDWNRPHYPTVFAVSAPASNKNTEAIYFFYNSQKLQADRYDTLTIHKKMDFVNFPNYFPSGYTAPEQVTNTQLPVELSLLSRDLKAQFLNFIQVGGSNPDVIEQRTSVSKKGAAFRSSSATNLFSEIRFFPFLESVWNANWIKEVNGKRDTTLPTGHYLALSIGSQPALRFRDSVNNITNPLYLAATRYFPSINPNTLQVGPGKYLQGFATQDVEMVASIDPNGLQVLQICPDGPNRYKVKLRMEVCNEGYMHEKNFGFRLIDHTNVISQPEFVAGTPPNLLSSTAHEWNYRWDVFLDAVPLPSGNTRESEEENAKKAPKTCDTLIFTVTTNWLGVQKLARGEGLELCVKFTNANEECHYNYELDERKLSPFAGYECGELSSSTGACCIPVYITMVLAILILLLLIWLAWKLRRQFA